METDIPPNGNSGEQQPPRRRTRFEEAPDDVKNNLPPPGRVNGPNAVPLRPPGLMAPPGMRPRPLMSNLDDEPLSFFNNGPRGNLQF